MKACATFKLAEVMGAITGLRKVARATISCPCHRRATP